MVDKICGITTLHDFMDVGLQLADTKNRILLYREIGSREILLCIDDAWTHEEVEEYGRDSTRVLKALELTRDEEIQIKLLRRLQLLSFCNPGIERYISQFLKKACV